MGNRLVCSKTRNAPRSVYSIKMKTFSITLYIICFACSVASATPPFQISITPESCSGQVNSISCATDSKRCFYVILTNTTKESQRVFETSNSWGYQSISFELILSSGKTEQVSMKPQVFTRNFPSTFTIPSRGHYVFPIILNDDWHGIQNLRKDGRAEASMKAIYELSETIESKENAVWTGKIVSEALKVEINHR